MIEAEKKEIKKLENIIANVHPFYVETIAEKLIKKGYGNVEDYKKEIERLRKAKVIYGTVDRYSDNLETALKEVSHLQNVIREDREQFDERLKRAKQQVAKEIVERLKLNMYRKSIIKLKDNNSPDLYTEDMEKVIDELLKEYGVEIENE